MNTLVTNNIHLIYEIIIVVNIKNRYFWNVTICSVVCANVMRNLLHSSMLNVREIRVQ